MKCRIKNCKNSYNREEGRNRAYFKFPKDPDLLEKWLQCCDNSEKFKRSVWRVCHEHFKDEQIFGQLQSELGIKRKRVLENGAIPSIFKDENMDLSQKVQPEILSESHENVNLTLLSEIKIENTTLDDSDQLQNMEVLEVVTKIEPMEFMNIKLEDNTEILDDDKVEIKHEDIIDKGNVETVERNENLIKILDEDKMEIKHEDIIDKVNIETVERNENLKEILHKDKVELKHEDINHKGNIEIVERNENLKENYGNLFDYANIADLDLRGQIYMLENENKQLKRKNEGLERMLRQKDKEIHKLKETIMKTEYQRINMLDRLRSIFTEGQVARLLCGKRSEWSDNDFAQSYTLFAESGSLYRFLRRKRFPLPAIRLLRIWARKNGINQKRNS